MDKNFWPPILALMIPLVALLIPIVAIVLKHRFKAKQEQMLHETLRQFSERGQSVPPELFVHLTHGESGHERVDTGQRRLAQLLRRAVILVAVGLGLGLMLFFINLENGQWTGDNAWAVGLVPLVLGGAYGWLWRHESRSAVKSSDQS